MTVENIIAVAGVCFGSSGITAIILAYLQRKWAKKDKHDERVDALVNAQKVMMIDRVRHLARTYIAEGEVSLAEKETVLDMYAAYKALGGNGHLDNIIRELDKVKVVEP